MRNLGDAQNKILKHAREFVSIETQRLDLLGDKTAAGKKDELDKTLSTIADHHISLVRATLEDVTTFPPQHLRHDPVLEKFHKDSDYEHSVFVMTKYPDPKKPHPKDAALLAVIQAVRDAVKASGYEPRVAIDERYHPILWDNVELYLLGCKRGIAIVEDRYKKELNPNVAMEWGWMRGMGRDVLYLIDDKFKHKRADWGGLIEDSFDWDDPVNTIGPAVKKWLQ